MGRVRRGKRCQPFFRRGTGTFSAPREYPLRDQKKQAVWFRGVGGECRCAVRIANHPEEKRTTRKRYLTPFLMTPFLTPFPLDPEKVPDTFSPQNLPSICSIQSGRASRNHPSIHVEA